MFQKHTLLLVLLFVVVPIKAQNACSATSSFASAAPLPVGWTETIAILDLTKNTLTAELVGLVAPVASTNLIVWGFAQSKQLVYYNTLTKALGTVQHPPQILADGFPGVYGSKVFFHSIRYNNGSSPTTINVYDTTTKSWSTINWSVGRIYAASATSGTKIFFAGGFNSNDVALDVIDIYDVAAGTLQTHKLSAPRYSLSAVAVGTKVLFAGGQTYDAASNNVVPSSVVDIYDTHTNTWTTAMLKQPGLGVMGAVVGTKAYFAGGQGVTQSAPYNPRGRLYSDIIDIYDSSTNTWSTALLPVLRGGFYGLAAAGTKVFFPGGTCPGEIYSTSYVDILDTSTGTWTSAFLSNSLIFGVTSIGSDAYFLLQDSSNSLGIIVDSYHYSSTAGHQDVQENVPSQQGSSSSSSSSSGLPGWGIALIVVGAAMAVALIVIIAVIVVVKRRADTTDDSSYLAANS